MRYYCSDNQIPSQKTSSKTASAAPTTTSSNNKNDNGSNANNANGNNNNTNGLSEAQLRQMRLTVVEQRKKAILERFVYVHFCRACYLEETTK